MVGLVYGLYKVGWAPWGAPSVDSAGDPAQAPPGAPGPEGRFWNQGEDCAGPTPLTWNPNAEFSPLFLKRACWAAEFFICCISTFPPSASSARIVSLLGFCPRSSLAWNWGNPGLRDLISQALAKACGCWALPGAPPGPTGVH